MKKIIYIFFIFLSGSISQAQLANQNMYLLSNLNLHPAPTALWDYSACWGYVAPDGREYAMIGCYQGTSIVDITDSANIKEVDFVSGLSSEWREMKTYSHYAYIVSEASGSALQIVDLQYLPDSIHYVKTWNYPGYSNTHTISQSGHYLYLNGGSAAPNGGIAIVDIADPENPVKLGQWTAKYVHDCRVLNDTIWASNIYTGQTSIINATNKNNPVTVRTWSSYPISTVSTHSSDITRDRNYILTANEISSPNGKLNVYNIQDLDNITFVTEWQPTNISTSIVHNVEIYGDYAVIAHFTAGIRIVNISNPVIPTEVAWYDTEPLSNSATFTGCWGVYKFPSGKIIGSDMSNGLFVVKSNIYDLNHPPVKLDLKVSIEGFHNSSANTLSRKDTVTVYLRNITSPFAIVDSAKAPVDTVSLKGSFKFSNTLTGSYYIVVKHFNSIETWSKSGGEYLIAEGAVYDYDFTNSDSQAYGDNMTLKGTAYCMFSGDVNRSNDIDLDDVLDVYNEAVSFSTGIGLLTDLTGDNLVDLSDISIVFNNSNNFISTVSPMIFVK